MEKRKIALVRADNILPINGSIQSLSNTPNLLSRIQDPFESELIKLLDEKDAIPKVGFRFTKEELDARKSAIDEYLPLMSEYNSVILFALNGLVPDDIEIGVANNTFSDRDFVYIDDLDYHLTKSKVKSIVATDTAIEERVDFSPKAVLLIRKSRYDQLTEEEKKSIGISIKVFEGDDLRTIVADTLTEMGYIPERPLLGSGHNGYDDSPTKDSILERIKEISTTYGIPQKNNQTYSLENELEKMENIQTYFLLLFYSFLHERLPIEDALYRALIQSPESKPYISMLMSQIGKDLNKYKQLTTGFNKSLEVLLKEGKLPSPEKISKYIERTAPTDVTFGEF